MTSPIVYALNAFAAGVDTIDVLISRGIRLAGVIGPAGTAVTAGAAGATDMVAQCRRWDLPLIPIQTYALDDARDRLTLSGLSIDVLLVVGWQRLIPEWLLRRCRHGAVGIHGSPFGIAGGRGRSPMNWAMILGEREFELSIFRLEPTVDSGPVYETASFPISESDDIATCYRKSSLLAGAMIARAVTSGALEQGRSVSQKGPIGYFPQRSPDDGAIDWRMGRDEILRFVRALTRPYPGAYSALGDRRVTIWRARPFTSGHDPAGTPGEIIHRFADGSLLVHAGDGAILADDITITPHAAVGGPSAGEMLTSVDFTEQLRTIIKRHRRRHPSLPVALPLLRAAAMDPF